MNKVIVTEPHLMMVVVGPSGSGKTRLVADILIKQESLFSPSLDKVTYVYQHWQKVYTELANILDTKISFVHGLDWSKINSTHEKNRQLVVFDDVYNEASEQEEFLNLVISGRHRNRHAILLKHNLYQKSKNSKTIDLNVTHMLLLKNPRDIIQIDVLGRQLGSRNLLLSAYKTATQEPFGHLLIDLNPRCCEQLRLCSNLTDNFTIFYSSQTLDNKIQLDESFTSSDYFQTAYGLQTCIEAFRNSPSS